MNTLTHPTVAKPACSSRHARAARPSAVRVALATARWSWRALRAAWRWLPECRPIMAADLVGSPEGVHRLMVNGRWVVVDRRRDA